MTFCIGGYSRFIFNFDKYYFQYYRIYLKNDFEVESDNTTEFDVYPYQAVIGFTHESVINLLLILRKWLQAEYLKPQVYILFLLNSINK